MLLIDKLCYTSKLIEKNPVLKCAFAVLTLIICICANKLYISLGVLIAMSLITVFLGGIDFLKYLRLMILPCAFLALSTFAIAINITDTQVFSPCIQIFGKYFSVSPDSLNQAARLFLVALASVSCLYFLALSTPITDIVHVLRLCKMPLILIELMFLIYRFIFVLLAQADSIYASQQSRLGHNGFKRFLNSSAQLMSALLVKSFMRTGKLYDAMESRCFEGTLHTLYTKKAIAPIEIIGIIIFELILISAAILVK